MADIIQFPRRPIDDDNAPRVSDGSLLKECDEHVHVFASVPGRCQCGKNSWTGTDVEEHLNTPLLRTEKPKRSWPDDFRGFLSNVRPKKQR